MNKWLVAEVPALSHQPESGRWDVNVKPIQAPGSWRASRPGGTRQTWSESRKPLRHSSPPLPPAEGKHYGHKFKGSGLDKTRHKRKWQWGPFMIQADTLISPFSAQLPVWAPGQYPSPSQVRDSLFPLWKQNKTKLFCPRGKNKNTTDTDILGSFSETGKSSPIVPTQSLTSQDDQFQT